ncbi:hypothetical protein HanIR_Chr03g0100141 [Helianthus annuus]|nr:hypothetical protein HanIR_Chr03g0100141 [Helianthus annuus]
MKFYPVSCGSFTSAYWSRNSNLEKWSTRSYIQTDYLCDCIFCRIVLLASAQVFYKIMKTMKIKDED